MQTPSRACLIIAVALAWLALPATAQFLDHSQAAGINNTGQNRGVAIVDYDGDGWEDIYFTRLNGPNLLYRNNSDGTFTELAAAAGLAYAGASGSAVWGDIDNDGYPDLVLGNRQENSRIYRNLGNGTFADITAGSGVQNNAQVMSVNLADVDQDGWLDIYFANLGSQNALYRNNGDGTFSNYTFASGALDDGIAMGAVFFDYDRDGDPDLYLTHDANQPNMLYRNTGQGVFADVSRESGLDLAAQGMGVDVADVDNDGWPDLYITNLYENALFRNLGNGRFENISQQAGVTDRGMGWGTVFFDFDNDGFSDIYVANETTFPVDYQYYNNVLYRNTGNAGFRMVLDDEILKSPHGAYGVATADLDQDGLLELVIANSGQAGNQLLLNRTEAAGHWVSISLEGRESNRSAIGARIELIAGELRLSDEIIGASGFAGQNSLRLHFGLGDRDQIDSLRIIWPSGLVENYGPLSADRRWHFVEHLGLTALNNPAQNQDLSVQLTPNPARQIINVQLNLPFSVEKCNISLYNLNGQLIYSENQGARPAGRQSIAVRPRPAPPVGIYYLKITADNRRHTEPLVFSDR